MPSKLPSDWRQEELVAEAFAEDFELLEDDSLLFVLDSELLVLESPPEEELSLAELVLEEDEFLESVR